MMVSGGEYKKENIEELKNVERVFTEVWEYS
jgi:hypothetical protein